MSPLQLLGTFLTVTQGQVTPIAIASIGYRYYYLFIVCNFTNAVFFWLLLPETSRLSLERINLLFDSPWIVAGKSKQLRVRVDAAAADFEVLERHKGALDVTVEHHEDVKLSR